MLKHTLRLNVPAGKPPCLHHLQATINEAKNYCIILIILQHCHAHKSTQNISYIYLRLSTRRHSCSLCYTNNLKRVAKTHPLADRRPFQCGVECRWSKLFGILFYCFEKVSRKRVCNASNK